MILLLLALAGCGGKATCEGAPVYADHDGDGFGDPGMPFGACDGVAGAVADATDCDDADPGVFPGAPEACDGVDHDCDGVRDEGGTPWYADYDHDGHGDPALSVTACSVPPAFVATAGDCAPDDAAIHPGAVERCDDVDADCDGLPDADDPDAVGGTEGYRDDDRDGYGTAEVVSRCDPADVAARAGDCDDADATTFPGAPPVCGDEGDHDCDGAADTPEADADRDGAPACEDCDDADPLALPGATEVCDGHDNDCDGTVDGPLAVDARRVAPDADRDGYGDSSAATWACDLPVGWSDDVRDCDDTNDAVSPEATETCATEADDDCDGNANEVGVRGCVEWYVDADGDGYGDGASVCQCAGDATYPTDADGDCDGGDPAISPAASELCFDGVDQDCDGSDWCHPDALDVVAIGPADARDFGTAAVVGEDLTGDGVGDLVVGDQAWAGYTGRVHVYPGPVAVSPTPPTWTVAGSGGGVTQYGEQVELGDLDGDGVADLLGGTEYSDWGGNSNTGAVVVHRGPLSGDSDTASADAVVFGPRNASVGRFATVVDDLDGDGMPELAVGSPFLGDHGMVALLPGDLVGEVEATAATVGVEGSSADDLLGGWAAGVDWNGDGAEDLVVGSPYSRDDGVVLLFAGPLTGIVSPDAADVTWEGGATGSFFGDQVYVVGDVDGDGIEDVVARGETDAALLTGVVPGSYAMSDSTATFRDAVNLLPAGATAGDFNGDGAVDLHFGASTTDPYPDGASLVFTGPLAGGYEPEDASWATIGAYATVVGGSAGDVDGDGRDDALLVVPEVTRHGGIGMIGLVPGSLVP